MISRNAEIIYNAICKGIKGLYYNKYIPEILNDIEVEIKKLDEVSVKIYCESPEYSVPQYAHEDEDACMDLRAQWIETKIDRIICHTGIHIELPKNYQLNIYPRSSIVNTDWYIPNSPGIVDSGYRGEILVVFRHPNGLSREDFPFKEGDRIAQCQVVAYQNVVWERVNFLEELSPSKRGEGGYGSTKND